MYHFFAAALIVNLRAAFTIETSKKYYEPFRQTATPTPPYTPPALALTVTEHFQLECTSCWREIPLTCKTHAVECISKKETEIENESTKKNRKSSKNKKNKPKFYKAHSTLAKNAKTN